MEQIKTQLTKDVHKMLDIKWKDYTNYARNKDGLWKNYIGSGIEIDLNALSDFVQDECTDWKMFAREWEDKQGEIIKNNIRI